LAQWHITFQNLCISSGSGPTGIGDEIKTPKDTKSDEITFFKDPQDTYKEAKLQNLITSISLLPQAQVT
jgi:hypothetical protein